MQSPSSFSEVGDRYPEELARGLRPTGEPATYFARKRIARVRDITRMRGVTVRTVLDFGCGTGTSFALLREAFPEARVLGFEPAGGLAAIAERAAGPVGAELIHGDELSAASIVDVVYCNGVFHHIAPEARLRAAKSLSRALRSGGLSFIWENSPFNPGTRLVMSRVSFDHDALLLRPRELRSLQLAVGLAPLATEFHFIFPRALRFMRRLEGPLKSLPLGGQYVVVGRRHARDG